MKFLLDTHTFIWFVTDNPKLSQKSIALIEDLNNEIFVSIATFWEIAIKMSIGKLELKMKFSKLIEELKENEMTLLEIEFPHLVQLISLPFYHRDPFDRLLIAQSMVEKMALVSYDSTLENYPIQRLW